MNQNPLNDEQIDSILSSLGKGYLNEFEQLPPEVREYIRSLTHKTITGDSACLEALYAVDYEHKVVSPQVFFSHTDYLGTMGKSLYPAWWDHLMKICDPERRIYEVILTGSMGGGKTHIGSGMLAAYHLHRVLCLKNPATFYGLADQTKIVFGIYSHNLESAEESGFYVLRDQILASSPFFTEVYPRKPSGVDYIEFNKPVKVLLGSSSLHAAGKNMFFIAVDEMNAMKKGATTAHKAQVLANEVSRRVANRFRQKGGHVPGCCVFISSAKTLTDFTAQRIKIAEGQPGVYVVTCVPWEGFSRNEYSPHRFRVQIGGATSDDKVLDEVIYHEDGTLKGINPIDVLAPDAKLLMVPIDHYREFRNDPSGSIADLAGHSTKSAYKLIASREAIRNCINMALPKPFDADVIECYVGSKISIETLFPQDKFTQIQLGNIIPIRHPDAPRYIHVDLSIRNDLVGIAMLHASHHAVESEQVKLHEHKQNKYDIVRQVEVDFVLGLKSGPQKQAIDYDAIRRFIFYLRNIGYWIRLVTYDSFQSQDSINLLQEAKINAQVYSVDRNCAAYVSLRDYVNMKKISYPNVPFMCKELEDLNYDPILRKVDHPMGGSKDLTDAVAGALFGCINDTISPKDKVVIVDTTKVPSAVFSSSTRKKIANQLESLQQELLALGAFDE